MRLDLVIGMIVGVVTFAVAILTTKFIDSNPVRI
ncbi:MAG: hypothetical protein ACI9SB_001859 [Candidatus Azotimanducaceae bacterium]|jgi:hypothetical protein